MEAQKKEELVLTRQPQLIKNSCFCVVMHNITSTVLEPYRTRNALNGYKSYRRLLWVDDDYTLVFISKEVETKLPGLICTTGITIINPKRSPQILSFSLQALQQAASGGGHHPTFSFATNLCFFYSCITTSTIVNTQLLVGKEYLIKNIDIEFF